MECGCLLASCARRVNGTSRRASGWAGEKDARNRGLTRLPLKSNGELNERAE